MKRAIARPPARLIAAIVGMVALGVGVGGYILSNQRLRFPLLEEKPFADVGRAARTPRA